MMNATAQWAIRCAESGIAPDAAIRAGIRRLCAERLREIGTDDVEAGAAATEAFVRAMDAADVALVPAVANAQHYEVPAEFFGLALGPHRKYSCAWWPEGVTTLAGAEMAALEETARRAGLDNGQSILDLGCGWGSLTLWAAARYTRSHIVGVSNSQSQRAWILAQAARRRLTNVEVITADMNRFSIDRQFDRVVSVEMFEHMRNWRTLFGRVERWLSPGGRFLMHVFCHRSTPYPFVDTGPGDWMSRHFFSGGMMPSDDLALRFQDALRLVERWRWDGRHYEKTANAWLTNVDAQRDEALAVLGGVYGRDAGEHWLQRWRIFFMACAGLFGYRDGQEWWVSHYLFEKARR
jgi:cyclopropane-fatty-acyl-phospholipid synthase